jgi:hypothetical protein
MNANYRTPQQASPVPCPHPFSINTLAKTVAQGAGKPAIYFDKIDIQSFRKISPETRHIFPLSK